MASSTPPGCGRSLSLRKYSRRRRMRWTFSARLTTWNQVENARTRSRASAGGRPRTRAASSAARLLVALAAPDRGDPVLLDELEQRSAALLDAGSRRRARPARARHRATPRASAENGYRWRFKSIGPACWRWPRSRRRCAAHDAEALPGGRLHDPPAAGPRRRVARRVSRGGAPRLRCRRSRCPDGRGSGGSTCCTSMCRLVGGGVAECGTAVRGHCGGGALGKPSAWRPERGGGSRSSVLAVDDESGETALVHGSICRGAGCAAGGAHILRPA